MIFSSHNREILFTMSGMDLKMRYQNSKLGMLWSVLKPMMQFFAYYIVFGVILKVGESKDYAIRLFLGILLWNFFVESTGSALMCYIGKKTVITKIHVDRSILPVSVFLTAFFNFGLTMFVFVAAYIVFAIRDVTSLHINQIGIGLFCFVSFGIFIISVNIVLATLNALFRDIQTMWDLVLSYLVFLSPIMYSIDIPLKYQNLYYFINPLAYPIEGMRSVFFVSQGNWDQWGHCAGYLLAVLAWSLAAWTINKKLGGRVTDFL